MPNRTIYFRCPNGDCLLIYAIEPDAFPQQDLYGIPPPKGGSMPTDKEIKKEFKKKASKDPERFYATSVLRQEGFQRRKCPVSGHYFWSVNPDQETCGDPACSGGFRFIGNTPAKKKLDYIGVWKEFSRLFSKWGYTPIKRYPVAARWSLWSTSPPGIPANITAR